jgi:hypothetical protein
MEIIRDASWQFAGFLVSVVAMMLTWYAFKKQQAVKQITYTVTKARMMSDPLQMASQIEVMFNGKKAVDPYLATIKVMNTGTIAVQSSDYEFPLTVSFGDKANILLVEVSDTEPSDIKQHVQFDALDHQRIVFQKFLMNPCDSFTILAIVDGYDETKLTGRIIGVSSIQYTNYNNELPTVIKLPWGFELLFALLVSGSLWVIREWVRFTNDLEFYSWFLINSAILLVLIAIEAKFGWRISAYVGRIFRLAFLHKTINSR